MGAPDPTWWSDEFPSRPGVYLFRDAGGKVLYVGKASVLRSRLGSYRRPGGDGRVQIPFLSDEAQRVETIVTRTEGEALLLEDTLIKQHKPLHNIRLKDDKSFRMLRVDLSDRFPRLKHVRAHSPDIGKQGGRSRYFGPFPSAGALRRTLSDLHRVVPLRDCPDSVMGAPQSSVLEASDWPVQRPVCRACRRGFVRGSRVAGHEDPGGRDPGAGAGSTGSHGGLFRRSGLRTRRLLA